MPTPEALDTDGMDLAGADLDVLLSVDADVWKQEAALIREHFDTFGDRFHQLCGTPTTTSSTASAQRSPAGPRWPGVLTVPS